MDSASRLRDALTRSLRSIAMDSDTAFVIELFLRGLAGTAPVLSAALPYALGDSIRLFGHVRETTEASALQLIELFHETGALQPLRAALMLLCVDRMGLPSTP
jgi:hypothetical protein